MAEPTIVLIEDDDCIRETFSDVLDSEGYKERSFANGREALDALRGEVAPDLILLDWMMPVMNGEQFLREQDELKAVPATTPIVVVTAQQDRVLELPGIRACVRKPITLVQLLDTVKEYRSRREPLSQPEQPIQPAG